MEADIASFETKGLPDNAVEFAGQIRATAIGSKDFDRLGEALSNTAPEHLNEGKCVALLERVVKKSQIRAAYIHKGLHQFSSDSQAHRSQDYQSKKFMANLNLLIDTATTQIPSLLTNPKFITRCDGFLEILKGKGEYHKVVNGQEYALFKLSLNNPKSQLNIVPRSFNINKYKIY